MEFMMPDPVENPMVTLGELVKFMESDFETHLDKKIPAIIRLDGKGFSKLTSKLKNPFNPQFEQIMITVTQFLCEKVQDVVAAYTQSDEITLVVVPKPSKEENKEPNAWYDFRVQKMASTSASMCAVEFYKHSLALSLFGNDDFDVAFDSRVFSCAPSNVIKVLMWRQQDCMKNSISKFAQQTLSHKQVQGKNGREKIEMCLEQDRSWEKDLSWSFKYGTFLHKEMVEKERPETGELYTRGIWKRNSHEKLFRDDKEMFSKLMGV